MQEFLQNSEIEMDFKDSLVEILDLNNETKNGRME